MGAELASASLKPKMRVVAIALIVAVAFAAQDTEAPAEAWTQEMELAQAPEEASPTEDLMQVVRELQAAAPSHMKINTDKIAKHTQLLQQTRRAKAYAHNFNSSKNAVKAALRSLLGQLNTGHRHDINALRQSRNTLQNSINNANSRGKTKTRSFRYKACPTKKAEVEADARKKAANAALVAIGKAKICNLRTTWGDMDVDKPTPAYGTELRNKWDRTRQKWLKQKNRYEQAKRVHSNNLAQHNKAMAAFRTACRIEADNAYRACRNAHAEYNVLKREVASNVRGRKQVYIASLVINCYIDHLTSNRNAKRCADAKRRSRTSQWNINPPRLGGCSSKATLANSFGPPNWTASKRTCAHHHWNERSIKERQAKERASKERVAKERASKERTSKERRSKELKSKEQAAKRKEKSDKARRREQKAKADERRSKELTNKERSAKNRERSNKERSNKERSNKNRERHTKRNARLYCHTRKVSSNHAGVIRVTQQGGYTLTGGGVNNRYRHWNARSGFEESYPETNGQWRCDTGFGAGQLDCYSRSCRTNVGNLSCRRWARGKAGSGAVQVNVGAGYTLTSCGLFNHYRHWNARAGFEEYFPNGNGCHGDMGFGWGHFTVYAMGCKAPAGHRLTCTTRRSGRGNYHVVGCPAGYTMTGCGIRNNYRGFNSKAGVEDTGVPHGNGCRCDTGFGTGDNYCYARCCKLN